MKLWRIIALVFIVVSLTNCASRQWSEALQEQELTPNEKEQVDQLLQDLYQSFSYGNGEEPDWELMRSVFLAEAQFVTEVPEGEIPKPQTIDEFIGSWQYSMRNSQSPSVATKEWILETKASKMGKLMRVDVLFQASKANDPNSRKPGFDSLVLAKVDGVWKVLSFIVHYESKL